MSQTPRHMRLSRSPCHGLGLAGFAADWASDQRAFKTVSWGKARCGSFS